MKILDKKIKAIVFDLDGTLYSNKFLTLNAMWYNLNQLFTVRKLMKIRKKLSGIDYGNSELYYDKLVEEVSKVTNKKVNEIKKWYIENFVRRFVKMIKEKYKPRERLNELLEILKSNDIKLAVFSDYPLVKERLEALCVNTNYFNMIVSSEDYGVLKPSARPLVDIADKLTLKTSEILVVGDKDDTDGESAKLAEMSFIKINEKETIKQRNVFLWKDFLNLIFDNIEKN